ncbi:MAG: deoxyhypusine synthase family protein [Candidatus Eisenbacteria bacterium]
MMRFFSKPVKPMCVEPGSTVERLAAQLSELSFQARNVGTAIDVWERMLDDRTIILFGLAGAMVPAGMRRIVAFLIRNRFVDCVVSTGANLFHDCHETLGYSHWRGSQHANDLELKENQVDRIYDTFASEAEFRETDEFICEFSRSLPSGRPLTTREFLYLLGKRLSERSNEEGILTSAFKAEIPIYCPAPGDSSIGIALAVERERGGAGVVFDVVGDVLETAQVASSGTTGVVYVGGGTPKNYIQQSEVTISMVGRETPGHKYAIQLITDPPHWGGLSGCTFEEAQSWGKIASQAHKVTVYSDATISLPLIITALASKRKDNLTKRALPRFEMGSALKIIF